MALRDWKHIPSDIDDLDKMFEYGEHADIEEHSPLTLHQKRRFLGTAALCMSGLSLLSTRAVDVNKLGSTLTIDALNDIVHTVGYTTSGLFLTATGVVAIRMLGSHVAERAHKQPTVHPAAETEELSFKDTNPTKLVLEPAEPAVHTEIAAPAVQPQPEATPQAQAAAPVNNGGLALPTLDELLTGAGQLATVTPATARTVSTPAPVTAMPPVNGSAADRHMPATRQAGNGPVHTHYAELQHLFAQIEASFATPTA